MSLHRCTEDGCPRWAIVTIIDDQSGSGGHLCLEHAEIWSARFLAQMADVRLRVLNEADGFPRPTRGAGGATGFGRGVRR